MDFFSLWSAEYLNQCQPVRGAGPGALSFLSGGCTRTWITAFPQGNAGIKQNSLLDFSGCGFAQHLHHSGIRKAEFFFFFFLGCSLHGWVCSHWKEGTTRIVTAPWGSSILPSWAVTPHLNSHIFSSFFGKKFWILESSEGLSVGKGLNLGALHLPSIKH